MYVSACEYVSECVGREGGCRCGRHLPAHRLPPGASHAAVMMILFSLGL